MELRFLNDLEFIRQTAEESGLGASRSFLWPLLCHVDPTNLFELPVAEVSHNLVDQVEKDVQRSMFLVERDVRERQRSRLRGLVNRVLDAHPELSYYQGFHDVASTILLVCKKTMLARCVLDRVATGPLRPLLAQDLTLVTGLLAQLFVIVGEEDPTLHSFLTAAGVQPYFALPWVLTWFSHSISSFAVVQRLFDLFLASSDPTMPFFVSVAIVLWSRPHLAAVECEYSAVHSFYSKLFADIPLQLNLDPSDPRSSSSQRLANLVEQDLELILARARLLALKHFNRMRAPDSRARPFIEAASKYSWERLPVVELQAVPKTSKQSLAELRYRFEGTLRKRRRKAIVKHASWILVISIVVVVLAIVVQRLMIT
jgi:hypothetical protein